MVSASFRHSGMSKFPLTSRPAAGQPVGGLAWSLPAMASSPFPPDGLMSRQSAQFDSAVFSRSEPSAAAVCRSETIQKVSGGRPAALLIDRVRLTRECIGRQLDEWCPGLDLL